MSLPEGLYRQLLRLYPAEHREAYEQLMLQHARDLSRAAEQRGRWHVAVLGMRLLADGVVNAGIEQGEALRLGHRQYRPVPWWGVLLASIPGLLIAFSRQVPAALSPLLPMLAHAYWGLLLLVLPFIFRHRRPFPVWALLPAGALIWWLTYFAGRALSQQANALRIPNLPWIGIETGIAVVQLGLAASIVLVLLRGQRVPRSAWLVTGVLVLGNVLLAALYSLATSSGTGLLPGMGRYFTVAGIGPVEGLMLVAAGLLAARQHGVLALLVVIGGYSYMGLDNDYLGGYLLRDWPGLALFLGATVLLLLVVVPVALLRARTRMGRLIGVLVPVALFHGIRIAIPQMVSQQPVQVRAGEIVWSINIMLGLVLAWLLYSHLGHAEPDSRLVAT